jgi:Zn-dependent protease
MLGLSALLVWMAVGTLSIVGHELGHALAARRWGVVLDIRLVPFGGVTSWRLLGARCWWKEAIVVAAGPAMGLIAAVAAWPFVDRPAPFLVGLAMRDVFYTNALWTGFNLLPVEPLDGGRLLRTFLERSTAVPRDRTVAWAGVVTAGLAFALLAVLEQTWSILPVALCGIYNLERLTRHREESSRTTWGRPSDDDRSRDRY